MKLAKKITLFILLTFLTNSIALAEDWEQYLRDQANNYYSGGNSWQPNRVYQKMTSDTSWRNGAWKCMETLKDFSFVYSPASVKARLQGLPSSRHTFRFNFEISDQNYQKQYLKPNSTLQSYNFQDHYSLPNKLVDVLTESSPGHDPQFWKKQNWQKFDGYKEVGEQWRALQYRSRTVWNPAPTNVRSLQRVLFLREVDKGGEKYDQWIQFTVHPPSSSELNSSSLTRIFDPVGNGQQTLVDFISVRFKDVVPDSSEEVDANGEYIKPQIAFRQFWRNDDGFFTDARKDRLAVGRGADTCYSCHANGMRELSPYPGSVWNKSLAQSVWPEDKKETQKDVFDYYRQRMKNYGQVSWGKSIKPESYGPPLGKKVGCATCHNNWEKGSISEVSRGAINWAFTASHSYHKMTSDASMPMNKRGAHGIARQFVEDFVSGKKPSDQWDSAIEGDNLRFLYRNWMREGGRSGDYPGLLQAVTDISESSDRFSSNDQEQLNLRKKQATAAAVHAEKNNKVYKKYLFDGSANNYSDYYRRETRDWLLEACDLEN